MYCLHEMATNSKEIIERPVNGEKALDVSWRFEAPHLVCALSSRLVRDFGAVIRILRGTVMDGGKGGPLGRGITPILLHISSRY